MLVNHPEAEGKPIVEDGQTNTAIAYWSIDEQDTTAEFAAGELQSYIERMSGVKLPVHEGCLELDQVDLDRIPTAVAILHADNRGSDRTARDDGTIEIPSEPFAAADTKLADRSSDAYTVYPSERATVLAGSTTRGTLYATYDLLERAGVRFFAPDFPFYDGYAERVPTKQTVTIPQSTIVEESSYEFRRKYVEEGWSHTQKTLPALLDWMAKTRHNVLVFPTDYRDFGRMRWDDWREQLIPELEKRGMLLESGGHGFDSFLPREEYEDAHPDWYVGEHNVFDITRTAAVTEYVSNVVTYLEKRPEIDIFDVWPPDQASWPPSVAKTFGSVANGYAYVVDRLAIELDQRDIDVDLEAAAYATHIDTPDPEYMYDESVIIDFAPYDRSYEAPLYQLDGRCRFDEEERSYGEIFDAWRETFDGEMGLYEYYRKYSWHSLPVALPELIGTEIPWYESKGLEGIGIYSEPADWITYELNHLLVAAFSWDTAPDGEDVLTTYLDDRYGAAAPAMRKYFTAVGAAGRTLFDRAQGDYESSDTVTEVLDRYDDARTALSEAAATTTDDAVLFLVDRLEKNIEFAIADTRSSYYQLEGNETAERRAKQRTSNLINEHCYDGILLKDPRVLNRCTKNGISISDTSLHEQYREQW